MIKPFAYGLSKRASPHCREFDQAPWSFDKHQECQRRRSFCPCLHIHHLSLIYVMLRRDPRFLASLWLVFLYSISVDQTKTSKSNRPTAQRPAKRGSLSQIPQHELYPKLDKKCVLLRFAPGVMSDCKKHEKGMTDWPSMLYQVIHRIQG